MEQQWEHAEEFLERIELAVEREQTRRDFAYFAEEVYRKNQDIRTLLSPKQLDTAEAWADRLHHQEGMKSLRDCALRFLAAEVCRFLDGADLRAEKWASYRDWAASLTPSDTIITFNYDLVLEKLSQHTASKYPSVLFVGLPGEVVSSERVPVFKLHGSVDWRRSAHGIDRTGDPIFALNSANSNELMLATPGPSKREMIEGPENLPQDKPSIPGPLVGLWDAAAEAIRRADDIVFLGYRIPPSDAFTRQWIVKNLRENEHLKNNRWLAAYPVLGEDVQHKDARRLQALLRSIGGHLIEVFPQPMRAEDYLAVTNRHDLRTSGYHASPK